MLSLYAALSLVHVDTGFVVGKLNDTPHLLLISPLGSGQTAVLCLAKQISLSPVINRVPTVRKRSYDVTGLLEETMGKERIWMRNKNSGRVGITCLFLAWLC